jgi:hypothetical protein
MGIRYEAAINGFSLLSFYCMGCFSTCESVNNHYEQLWRVEIVKGLERLRISCGFDGICDCILASGESVGGFLE